MLKWLGFAAGVTLAGLAVVTAYDVHKGLEHQRENSRRRLTPERFEKLRSEGLIR